MDVNAPTGGSGPQRLTEGHWSLVEPAVTAARSRFVPWPIDVSGAANQAEVMERMREFTVAHWNDAVVLLDSGAGYSLLVGMLGRLRGRLREVSEEEAEAHRPREIYHCMVQVLESEVEANGGDTLVELSLDGEGDIDREGWLWARIEPRYRLPGQAPVRYRLVHPDIERIAAKYPDLAWTSGPEIEIGRPWSDHLRRAKHKLDVASSNPRLSELNKRKQMIDARIHVVGAVLEEFETIGFVAEMAPDQPLALTLDEDQKAFVEAALEALAVVDDEEERDKRSVRRSFNAVTGLIGADDSLGWDKDKIRGFVVSRLNPVGELLRLEAPLFETWEGQGSGPGPRSAQDDRYEAFRAGIIAIATAAGMDTPNVVGSDKGDGAQ